MAHTAAAGSCCELMIITSGESALMRLELRKFGSSGR